MEQEKFNDFHLEEIHLILSILASLMSTQIEDIDPCDSGSSDKYSKLENVLSTVEEQIEYLPHLDVSLIKLDELNRLVSDFAIQIKDPKAVCDCCQNPNKADCMYNCPWPALVEKMKEIVEERTLFEDAECQEMPQ